mgnify:CR=1 FL=1
MNKGGSDFACQWRNWGYDQRSWPRSYYVDRKLRSGLANSAKWLKTRHGYQEKYEKVLLCNFFGYEIFARTGSIDINFCAADPQCI